MNQQPEEISAGIFILGLVLAIFVGLLINVFFGVIAMSFRNPVLATLLLLVPGGAFILLSRSVRKNGMAQGLMIGGCIVALIGGLCGITFGSM